MFFEGPEKKVELSLMPGRPSLRSFAEVELEPHPTGQFMVGCHYQRRCPKPVTLRHQPHVEHLPLSR